MTVHLRRDQECSETDCGRPARHAELCSPCYRAASPAARACCDALDRVDAEVSSGEARDTRALEDMWVAPAFQGRRAA